MIVVPKAFADSTIAREGERGAEWVASLPRVVSELCADWHVKPVGPVLHGYVAVVVPVDRDGEPIMLKVSWIDRSSEQEALVLRAWNGDGAVRLLAAREDLGAMLLEGLEADRTLEHVAIDDAVRTASTLLRRLAIPAPAELRTVTEELSDIRESLPEQWERAGRPFGRRLLDASLDAASPDASGPTLRIVNQDLHYGNVLAARREPTGACSQWACRGGRRRRSGNHDSRQARIR